MARPERWNWRLVIGEGVLNEFDSWSASKLGRVCEYWEEMRKAYDGLMTAIRLQRGSE